MTVQVKRRILDVTCVFIFVTVSRGQEEIDGLMRENKELKSRQENLEEQLRTALDPGGVSALQPDDRRVSSFVMEEWRNKLQAATDVCEKIKQDMDKLREVQTPPPLLFLTETLVAENLLN